MQADKCQQYEEIEEKCQQHEKGLTGSAHAQVCVVKNEILSHVVKNKRSIEVLMQVWSATGTGRGGDKAQAHGGPQVRGRRR